MDAADRLKESLVDTAWMGRALELFADELHNLELLEGEEEKAFQAELQRRTEIQPEPAPTQPPSGESRVVSHERKDAAKPKKGSGPQPKRGAGERMVGSLGPAGGPAKGIGSALYAAKEREAAMVAAREQEFWYRTIHEIKQQQHHSREGADTLRAHARRQQRFFNARNIDEYRMDEILQGTPRKVSIGKVITVDFSPDEAHGKYGASEEISVTVLSSSTFPTDARGPRLRSAGPDAMDADGGFTIDAVGFARDLNTSLEREYGFRPVVAAPEDKAAVSITAVIGGLKSKLLTHAPGDLMELGAPWSATLPPVGSTTEVTGVTRRLPLAGHTADDTKGLTLPAIIPHDSGVAGAGIAPAPLLRPPPFPAAAVTTAAVAVAAITTKTTTTRKLPGTKRVGGAAKATAEGQARPVAVASKKVFSPFAKIECSAEDRCVVLQTTVGVEVSATVRFINREPNLLRVRIPSSKHAWITYSMVNSSVDRHTSPVSSSPLPPPSSSYCVATSGVGCTTLNEPLGCGGFVEVRITFRPQSATAPLIREVLRLGHCRELNSRRGEGAQWHFFDVTLHCKTILPQFRLRPIPQQQQEGEGETGSVSSAAPPATGGRCRGRKTLDQTVTKCEFPYTYVMDTCSRRFYLENTGSVAVVKLSSTDPCFTIDPPPDTAVLLPGGDRVDITVHFTPMQEMRYEAEELLVTVLECEEGPVVSEHRFGLYGEGVLPHVELVRIGTLTIAAPQQDASVPQYIVPDTAPDVESEVLVAVRNRGPIAVPYFWRTDTVGGGSSVGEGVSLRVTPATGVFPPWQESCFTVTLRPAAAQPLAAVLNLFLEGLLVPPVDATAVLDPYLRGQPIPAVPSLNALQVMPDPYIMFQNCTREQPKDCCGVFAVGFYLFTDPVLPSFHIIPDHLEEGVECLVHYSNMRRITMKNSSPRPLHFCFDPSGDECPPGVLLSTRERERLDVSFEPRKGCVPPHTSVTVQFRFTLREVGYHFIAIDCYIPELMELLAATSAAAVAEETSPATKVRCSHHLHLSVTGVGPSVHLSTDCLDFGLIEHGGEAEASFTVSNDNPIPVVFDLHDPMLREPPRFVFLPPTHRLGARDSVEVTVYRQAVELGDSQTFFELTVRGGDTLAIETRATIQVALLVVQDTVLDFGLVPEGVWAVQNLVVSNASAFDIPYTVEPVVLPACIQLITPPPGVVRAGHQNVSIPISCAFDFQPGRGEWEALLSIKNTRVKQETLVELRCAQVQQLAVALDLIPVPKMAQGACSMAYTPPVLPHTLPSPLRMEIACFIEALLWNLVELRVVDATDALCPPGTVTELTDLAVTTERPPTVLRPYCPPVVLKSCLPDKEPVWSELLVLRVSNQTGCLGSYTVEAMRYPVKGSIKESSRTGTLRETHAITTAREAFGAATSLDDARLPMQRSNTTVKGKREKRQYQQRPSAAPYPAGRTEGSAEKPSLKSVQRSFWCKDVDGTDQMERERRATLVDAQKILLDGRGGATIFGNAPFGPLYSHATVEVPLTIFANLPGRYEETLQVRCGDLPYTHIPLNLELSGKPVLLDSNTAGLTVLGGRELMLMPAVIAGVGRSRRSMLLINRVPRDLNVSVKIFLTTATFSVVAVDDEVEAAAVTLQLQPVSEEEKRRESEGRGKVAAVPETFFLPALASREVTVEYAPDATFVAKAGAAEREWRGGVIITAEVADSPFNDGFIIDEFYRLNSARYPAERVIKKQVREAVPAWMRSIVRPIVMLNVQQPLISRPGVVRNNVVLPSTPGELTVPRAHFSMGASHLCGGAAGEEVKSKHDTETCFYASTTTGKEREDDEDTDEEGAKLNEETLVHQEEAVVSRLPPERILANEEERQALYAFMEQRKLEMAEQSRHYFIPIELEVRARCGVARLAVEPSGELVRFPQYVEGEPCMQTVRLTNPSCAAMEFILDLPSSSFCVTATRFISGNMEEEPVEVDDEEEARGRRAVAELKWSSGEDRQKAQRLLTAARRQSSGEATVTKVRIENFSFSGRTSMQHGDTAFVTVTKYLLRPNDALEVQLAYCVPAKEEVDAIIRGGSSVEATLNIMYLPSDGCIQAPRPHDGGTPPAVSPPPVLELTQSVPIVLNFLSPTVRCSPAQLWFRPGQLLHDGRPQPSYAQKIQLLSSYPSAVTFAIVPSCQTCAKVFPALTATTTPDGSSSTAAAAGPSSFKRSTAREAAPLLTRGRQLKEVTRYWEEGGSGGGDDAGEDGANMDDPAIAVRGAGCAGPEQAQQERQQRAPQKEEQQLLVVTDPEHFTITPMQGIIPGATRGGQPGVCEIAVTFREQMNVRFEALYDVLINGCLVENGGFSLCGDSRVTEI
ncbi:hypothetical protein TraAM80_00745 [Trypanosoma rangeli]|uniref:Uncharacterized protein n=1 Tax=Trypanosoma rangeli TaxID=5698 RepID=A0A422P201_TRYRA|nr:uncharacterized protein TraAM80_00745 [Trypanosoma rangeli]RNF11762.1 hypothetical protein TraAM80_00745 [Trypanosoma rangeli]|eukprot:RNF11762.1 hypothetical protein TraAM80_00745 [Trypanosoma rangeli]